MSAYEIVIPSESRNINPQLDVVDRDGADVPTHILQIFGGDSFVGEVLSGLWIKKDDGEIDSVHTEKISSGSLLIEGKSHSAGDGDNCWIYSKAQIYAIDDTTLDVHLKVEGHSAANYFDFVFCLSNEKPDGTTPPWGMQNVLVLHLKSDTTKYYTRVQSVVAGSSTELKAETEIDNAECTFRIIFKEKRKGYSHIYLHDGSGAVDESTDEFTDSPFALGQPSNIFYPSYCLYTTEANLREGESEFVTVTYPKSKLDLAFTPSTHGRISNQCKAYDLVDSTYTQIFDADHKFGGNCVIQNGFIRLKIDNGVLNGLDFSYWNSTTYTAKTGNIFVYLDINAAELRYWYLSKIVQLNQDSIVVEVVGHNSASEDYDSFVRLQISMKAGSYSFQFRIIDLFPFSTYRFSFDSVSDRFGYTGDATAHGIADSNLSLTALNTTMTTNYCLIFDHSTSEPILAILSSNLQPQYNNARISASDSVKLSFESYSMADMKTLKFWLSLIPFPTSYSQALFIEAEDLSLAGSATTVNLGDDSGESVSLTSQYDSAFRNITPAEDYFPNGRYLCIFRAKDTNQVAHDLYCYFNNQTDTRIFNEEKTPTYFTLTADWAYYQLIFDITEDDTGDQVQIPWFVKSEATANTIYLDYIVFIPVSNGENWVQDLAYFALRRISQKFKLTKVK